MFALNDLNNPLKLNLVNSADMSISKKQKMFLGPKNCSQFLDPETQRVSWCSEMCSFLTSAKGLLENLKDNLFNSYLIDKNINYDGCGSLVAKRSAVDARFAPSRSRGSRVRFPAAAFQRGVK